MDQRSGSDRRKYRVSPVEGVEPHRSWIEEFLPDVGVAALRLSIAALILTHALQEHFGILLADEPWRGAPGMFTDRWIAATLLAALGALLSIGWWTRTASLALALIVTASWFAPARMAGHWMIGSVESIAIYTCVLIAIAIIGPGWFSVDAWRAGRFKARRSGMKVPISPWIKSQYRRSRLSR